MYKPLGSSTYGTPSAGASSGSQGGLESFATGSQNSKVQKFAQQMASEGITDSAEIKKRGLANGFTLIELLVCISIISVLMAIFLSNRATKFSRQTVCASNLGQIGKSTVMYSSANRFFLPTSAASVIPSNNALWNGGGSGQYILYGRLIESGVIPKSSSGIFFCPDSNVYTQNNLTSGVQNLGVLGKNVYFSFFQKGVPEGAPSTDADTKKLDVLIADYDHFIGDPGYNVNHSFAKNALLTDYHVELKSIDKLDSRTMNNFGKDSAAGNDGSWSRLRLGK